MVENLIEVEVDINARRQFVEEFFQKREIKIKSISKKDYDSKTKKIYQISIGNHEEVLSEIEVIQNEELDIKNGLKISIVNNKESIDTLVQTYLAEEKQKKIIKYKLQYENLIKLNFIKQPGGDGIEFIDQDTISKQREVISYLVKKVGSNLLLGKSIMNISLPTNIFDERSFLDSFTYGFRISPNFHDIAAESDSIEKLKLITSYAVSSLHCNLSMFKPFNPILGETFQCKVNNSLFYIEQTSHHPPIYNYLIKNPKFTSWGYNETTASTTPNSVTVTLKGKYFTKFKDGSVYTYTYPSFVINGLLLGRRTVKYENSLVIRDIKNNLISTVRFDPDDRSFIGKMFKNKSTFPDYFNGFIAKIQDTEFDSKKKYYKCDKKNIIENIEGEWTNHIKFNNKIYWEHGNHTLFDLEKMDFTLPSDSLFRDDILIKKRGNNDLALKAKNILEELQRKDRKLREQYAGNGK